MCCASDDSKQVLFGKKSLKYVLREYTAHYHKERNHQGLDNTVLFPSHEVGELKIKQSFSNPGTPLDNAVAESFFSCMKREELSHNYYDELAVLRHDVADYVDFFNNYRPHQKLGMLTPCEAEQKYWELKN